MGFIGALQNRPIEQVDTLNAGLMRRAKRDSASNPLTVPLDSKKIDPSGA